MLTAVEALEFARRHVEVWNGHDIEAILDLYSEDAELVSPLAASLKGEPTIRGRAAFRDYFARGLAKYPDLHFEIIDVFRCQSSVTVHYYGAGRNRVAEVMFLGAEHKIERVFAHYLCEPT
ncbi:MAG TPA: nuclear transport factor 2 family protein [Polyangiaceae bacterium]|jgi:ketosteroid isomerase-like protein|nr:nuclear transport factor 2 family protein [Polyangiaceae bacterium]